MGLLKALHNKLSGLFGYPPSSAVRPHKLCDSPTPDGPEFKGGLSPRSMGVLLDDPGPAGAAHAAAPPAQAAAPAPPREEAPRAAGAGAGVEFTEVRGFSDPSFKLAGGQKGPDGRATRVEAKAAGKGAAAPSEQAVAPSLTTAWGGAGQPPPRDLQESGQKEAAQGEGAEGPLGVEDLEESREDPPLRARTASPCGPAPAPSSSAAESEEVSAVVLEAREVVGSVGAGKAPRPSLRSALTVAAGALQEGPPALRPHLLFLQAALQEALKREELAPAGPSKRMSVGTAVSGGMATVELAQDIDDNTRKYLLGFGQQRTHRTFKQVARLVKLGVRLSARSGPASPRAAPAGPTASLTPELAAEMAKVDTWGEFDVFAVARLTGRRPLMLTAWYILEKRQLLTTFPIRLEPLKNFLVAMEEGYMRSAAPYHNNIHAADVTQTTHALMRCFPDNAFSDLEVLAGVLAAVCHDFEHPGLTNGFLQEDHHMRALIYNNRSVNENHHISKTWRIIVGQSDGEGEGDCNFLADLTPAQQKEIHSLMIKMVLATDMEKHFESLAQFNKVCAGPDPLKKTEAVTEALSLALHCADLSNVAKPIRTALRWADRVTKEFFLQGDRERAAGKPISPLCDRQAFQAAGSQIGFITYIVLPSFKALAAVADLMRPHGPMLQLEQNLAFWKDNAHVHAFADLPLAEDQRDWQE